MAHLFLGMQDTLFKNELRNIQKNEAHLTSGNDIDLANPNRPGAAPQNPRDRSSGHIGLRNSTGVFGSSGKIRLGPQNHAGLNMDFQSDKNPKKGQSAQVLPPHYGLSKLPGNNKSGQSRGFLGMRLNN